MDAMAVLLDFATACPYERLPRSVVERSRLAILDTLAALVAGHRGESVREVSALVADWGGKPESTAFVAGARVPLPLAVLANGTTARALDLDDVHEQNTCHVNVATVPVALALAEARAPVDGRAFMAAVALGAETIARLSAAPRVGFSETGMSLTYQCGFFGAAMVAARLLGLTREQAAHAMGIAYARVAGNQQGFVAGAMTVKLMQGIASEGGVVGALMAERGLTGSLDVLEGRFGYYATYHRGQYARGDIVDGLGERWRLEEVSVKPVYPCCKFIHGPIDAMREVLVRNALPAGDIARARFTITNKEVYDVVCAPAERKWDPRSVTDAQFSLPFMTAWAAVHGDIGFAPLDPASLADGRVRALMPRIEVALEAESQGAGRGRFPMPGILTLETRDGRGLQAVAEFVKGHPRNPMTFDDVADKFRACAAFGRPGWKGGEAVIEFVRNLEQHADVAELARLLAAGGTESAAAPAAQAAAA
jgi:2-methylcitrate dehydratase PrpD